MNLLVLTNVSAAQNYDHIFNAVEKLEHNLVGFVSIDNTGVFEKIGEYTIYPLPYLDILKYDLVLLNCGVEMAEKILIPQFQKVNFPVQKLRTVYWLLQQVMIKKYEDFDDAAIQETLKYWETPKELTVFNQHTEGYEHTFDEVFLDQSCGLPYIMFETVEGKKRRMYYPRNHAGDRSPDGKPCIKDVLREQVPTSPHLYVKDDHKVNDGDILIDAGVCEGNFALRYVDICSKVYLFEMDKKWWEPLYFSFRDCWDKVELITKACSDAVSTNRGGVAAIDEVVDVQNKNIFLKMDIEGSEPAALHGARKILSNNKVRASICAYHNFDDALKIKAIMQKYGYKTWTSAGYMVFIYDKNIWNTADFRKGIVYAENY